MTHLVTRCICCGSHSWCIIFLFTWGPASVNNIPKVNKTSNLPPGEWLSFQATWSLMTDIKTYLNIKLYLIVGHPIYINRWWSSIITCVFWAQQSQTKINSQYCAGTACSLDKAVVGLKASRTSLTNSFKVKVKLKVIKTSMSTHAMHKSTVIPSLNVIAEILSEIFHLKKYSNLKHTCDLEWRSWDWSIDH